METVVYWPQQHVMNQPLVFYKMGLSPHSLGDMWASQLLTINTDSPTTYITFDFEATPGYVGVKRFEVVMFNCLDISITIHGSTTAASICK